MPVIARFGALLLTIFALTLAAACGTSDGDATPTPSGSGSAPTATEAPAPTPTTGAEQPALDGTAWLLEGMNGVEMDLQEQITLAFADGQISGNAGCNDYSGAYTAGPDGALSIPEIIQTDMACEGMMELEAEYLGTLGEAARYAVIEDVRLELADSGGATVLVFTSDTRLPLDATSWQVTELDGQPVIDGVDVHFSLRAGEISGSGGCNTFGGQYSADAAGAFSTSELYWTEMGCIEPEGAMEQEQAFFTALGEIAAYQHDGEVGTLTLLDSSAQPRIVATVDDEEGDTGIYGSPGWVLEALGGQPVGADFLATIRFDAGQFAGTAGCVGYDGAFDGDPSGVITRVYLASSPAACDDPNAPGEMVSDYLAVLEDAAQFREAGDGLELLDAEGDVLAVYGPAVTDHQLDGTAWTLVTLDDAPALPDTEVTIEFVDGELLGNGGCNGYGGRYIVPETGIISIPPAPMTAMACTEPAGVMDQEAAYHQALSRARAYQFAESGLELLDGEGEVLLAFESSGPSI